MPNVLKLDPRPPDYGSVVEARADEDASATVDEAFEMAEWRAVRPEPPARSVPLGFVDGVQQYDRRFTAESEEWPIAGVLASYAAGAMCPGRAEPLCHVHPRRAAILGRGAICDAVPIRANGTVHRYEPHASPGDGPDALDATLNHLRSDLEAAIVQALIAEGVELIVVDGRLPPNTRGAAVGLIKTPQRIPISGKANIDVLRRLEAGERSPLFVRERSDRQYFAWFVCLRTPGPRDVALSGLALIEMDASATRDQALRTADITAAVLPRYASAPHRDPRAPQNLLPVGQLERALRHRLGDRAYVARLIQEAFAREEFQWRF